MTERERQIMELLRQDPMISQGELAKRLGITRSSVGVHLTNLGKKGHILGKGYVLAERKERYIVGVGGANIDIMGRSRASLVMEDSNPGFVCISVGGVTHNICENAARMGIPVRLITATGDDVYGEKIRRECQAAGIDTSGFMVVEGESSSTYLSLHHATGEMAVAMSDMRILQKISVEFLEGKRGILQGAGAIVMDCGLPEDVLQYLAAVYGSDIPIFVDPVSTTYAKKLVGRLRGIHTLKPNLLEAGILAEMPIDSKESLDEAARRIISQGVSRVIISTGKDGVYCRDCDGRTFRAWGPPMDDQIVNATGAGDAFMGGLAYAFLNEWQPEKSLAFAIAASRMAIAHQSTINPGINAENVLEVMERDGIVVKSIEAGSEKTLSQ